MLQVFLKKDGKNSTQSATQENKMTLLSSMKKKVGMLTVMEVFITLPTPVKPGKNNWKRKERSSVALPLLTAYTDMQEQLGLIIFRT